MTEVMIEAESAGDWKTVCPDGSTIWASEMDSAWGSSWIETGAATTGGCAVIDLVDSPAHRDGEGG